MSKIMWLIGRNIPLGHHERYSAEMAESKQVWGGSSVMGNYSNQKHLERTARTIVNGLSQTSVCDLVAAEWEIIPGQVRMAVTSFANGHKHSGNVTKGITYLDKKLGGKITRTVFVRVERVLRAGLDGRLHVDHRKINNSIASAHAAHAIVSRPAGYENMSPSQKRKHSEQLAKARREFK